MRLFAEIGRTQPKWNDIQAVRTRRESQLSMPLLPRATAHQKARQALPETRRDFKFVARAGIIYYLLPSRVQNTRPLRVREEAPDVAEQMARCVLQERAAARRIKLATEEPNLLPRGRNALPLIYLTAQAEGARQGLAE